MIFPRAALNYKFYFLLFVVIFLSACSQTGRLFTDAPVSNLDIEDAPKRSVEFKLLYIKSPTISYYDYSILRTSRDGTIILELFKLGRNFGNITIAKNTICFLNDCAPKWPASKRFFGKVAYGNLFDDILLSRDIFEGKGRAVATDGSSIQRFQQSGQIIYYQRTKNGVLFRNLTNGVIISLEKYIDPSKPEEIEEKQENAPAAPAAPTTPANPANPATQENSAASGNPATPANSNNEVQDQAQES
ncbi:MAG: hypothetical protein E7K04_05280 [Helicobacter sp.]|nr:hypothetical protein [Helicobacter sp.]